MRRRGNLQSLWAPLTVTVGLMLAIGERFSPEYRAGGLQAAASGMVLPAREVEAGQELLLGLPKTHVKEEPALDSGPLRGRLGGVFPAEVRWKGAWPAWCLSKILEDSGSFWKDVR